MPIYELNDNCLTEVKTTRFGDAGVKEREDLQRLLRDQIEVLVPDAMVLAEEFGQWDDSQRRIDLLLLDRDARLVVVELKRTERGGHMELQAIRYAAMVSTMTFEQAADAHRRYLQQRGIDADAEARLLEFLDWEESNEDDFGQSVRIVLASAEFSKELTTAVMWLNIQGLDISCVRLRPYSYGDKVLIDVQQVIPLPEAEEYQVRVREKTQRERSDRGSQWNEEKLLTQIATDHGEDARRAAQELLDWGEENADYVWWGRGKQAGMAVAIVKPASTKFHIFRIVTNGKIVFMLDSLHKKPPFNRPEILREIADRLKQFDGLEISDDDLRRRRRIPLATFANADAMAKVCELAQWMIELVRAETASQGDRDAH
ncbi:hypothetical protein NG895_05405 [Aeoliella sp. ICT_H6.2]|uniref:DUF91 domain-containing protein n=1 Tax=Aeoliella straminimaris TaxID=2954799 RepID=A0A9X2F6S3_9BACT|nr:hypothetical protein [Aeoliella straminimaris]MCO6043337.1 hypothetical protein [Aeoliella straminimaris]